MFLEKLFSIKKIIIIPIVFVLAYIFYLLIFFFSIGSNISYGVSQQSIVLIEMGMTKNEVINILGEPVLKKYNKFEYATKGLLSGVEVYIKFKNEKVNSILLEEFDVPFYFCDTVQCPKIIDIKTFTRVLKQG